MLQKIKNPITISLGFIFLLFLLLFVSIELDKFLHLNQKKQLCPQYYDILYKHNGDIVCVAPEPPKKFNNPPVYDPKLKEKR